MILREGSDREIVCDECGEEHGEVFHHDEFREMIEAAKSAGWKIAHDGHGEFRHICPDCQDDAGDRLAAQLALFGKGR